MRRPVVGGMIVLMGAMSAAASSPPVDTHVLNVAVAGRANANASMAADGLFVGLVWSAADAGGQSDIYAAVSHDEAHTFSVPRRVNDVPGGASISGEQPPRIALVHRVGHDPSITVVWTAKSPSGTRLLTASSNDGGRSFGTPAPIAGSEAPGNRGWESIAPSGDGAVAIWLDHRELASSSGAAAPMDHAAHQHAAGAQEADGVARAQLSKLFFARVDGTTPSPARALAAGVCYCCKTSVAADDHGGIYAVWRHVYPGDVRDIAFTMSSDGGRTFAGPVRVSNDGWVIDGCPENGPALAVDSDRRIHVVWPTVVPGDRGAQAALKLFYATSIDGRSFTSRVPLPTEGAPRHPQIAVDARGGLVVAWDENVNGTSRLAVVRVMVDARGAARFERVNLPDEAGVYPVTVTTAEGPVVAWTSGTVGRTVIRVARLG